MKRLLHFHEDMSIANSDAGCNIPLILLLPATFLLHTQQTHSGLGKTHPQLCCCAGHLLCLSLWSFPAQNCPVRGSLSLSLFPSVTSHTVTAFILKALLVLSPSHPTGHCGVNDHLQPALKLDSIIHYLFAPHTPPKASLFFLQQCPIGMWY